MTKLQYNLIKSIKEADNQIKKKLKQLGKLLILKKGTVTNQIWRVKHSISNWYKLKRADEEAIVDNRKNILTGKCKNKNKQIRRKMDMRKEHKIFLTKRQWDKL